jgi:hypothetical protein
MTEETLYFKCNQMMGFAGGFHISPDDVLNINMRNLSYPEYFDVEKFYETKVEIPIYELDYSVSPPDILSWDYISLPKSPVIHHVQKNCLELAARDYSDLTNDIPMIGGFEKENRRKDVQEEYMREATFGTLNKKYAEISYEFYDYLFAVNAHNIDFINKSTNGVNLITIGFYLIFIGFIIYEVYKMRGFYKKLFQIEVNFPILFVI